MAAALDQTLTAWHDGVLWHGLATLAVSVLFALALYRMHRTPGRTAPATELADPS